MDNSTIEALREVLQDMTLAIELISSGERSGEALIHFIEEMLKTIEAWAAKYNVNLDEGVLAMESARRSLPNPSPICDPSSYPDYPITNASEVKYHLEGSLILDQQLDVVDQVKEHDQTEGEAHRQSVKSLNQYGEGNEERGRILVHFQNDENERDERQEADKSKAKPLRRVSRKTRSQVALTSTDGGPMHMDGTSTDDGQVKAYSLEHLTESPKLTDATSPSEKNREVIKSPDWLPKGWITEMTTRGTSGSASAKDKYYFDPTSKRLFQSKKEVLAFLGTTKRKRGRPKKSGSLAELAQTTDESPRHTSEAAEAESIQESMMGFNPELQALSHTSSFINTTPANSSIIGTSTEAANSSVPTLDTTKRKRGRPRKVDSRKNLSQAKDQPLGHACAAGEASAVSELVKNSISQVQVPANKSSDARDMPPPVVASSAAASSGPVNSCIPMLHQTGQTSEWLVYESLASLPFPMFEHLRLVESNANKLANTNSPPTLWPWMLGNAEGLKKPFVDTKSNESKLVDESKQDQNAPSSSTGGETQAAEIVPKRPKKAARKNAS